MKDVCIIGGGISGLTLAYRLNAAGRSVTLLEGSPHLGGMIRTTERDGFLMEGGPNSSLAKPPLLKLIEDLGLQDEVVTPRETSKNRYLALEGRRGQLRLCAVPKSFAAAVRSPILSFPAKIRALLEPILPRGSAEDESVESFMSRRFGGEFAQTIVGAMLGGIWAADISRLSCRSALPFVWNLEREHRSVVRGAIRRYLGKNSVQNKAAPTIVTFRHGMSTLVQALTELLPEDSICLRSPVMEIVEQEGGVRIRFRQRIEAEDESESTVEERTIEARAVVLTTPAAVAGDLISSYAPELANRIERIPYAPVGVVYLAYPTEFIAQPLNGFGFLCPPADGRGLLGAIFSSALFPERAPEGYQLITAFCGGGKNPELADVSHYATRQEIIKDVSVLIGASAEATVLGEVYYPRAIPNFPLGHHQTQEDLAQFLKEHPRIKIVGSWNRGISIPDRIEAAELLAAELIESLSAATQDDQIEPLRRQANV